MLPALSQMFFCIAAVSYKFYKEQAACIACCFASKRHYGMIHHFKSDWREFQDHRHCRECGKHVLKAKNHDVPVNWDVKNPQLCRRHDSKCSLGSGKCLMRLELAFRHYCIKTVAARVLAYPWISIPYDTSKWR